MKTIGLIGGTSWTSTLEYYRLLNEKVSQKLGGDNSAKLLLYSFNFQELLDLKYELPLVSNKLELVAQNLERAGADCILICANTLHMFAQEIQSRISIPLINIIDATAERMKARNISKAGLLGTQFTMEEDFYTGKLASAYSIETLVPIEEKRKIIHDIIYDELAKGIFKEDSKKKFIEEIGGLRERGAQGVILGCTEIPLFINNEDVDMPLFNTTEIHAQKAVDFSLL